MVATRLPCDRRAARRMGVRGGGQLLQLGMGQGRVTEEVIQGECSCLITYKQFEIILGETTAPPSMKW